MTNDNKEIWGLRLELIGLIVIFIGAIWQSMFTSWWDRNLVEWQSYIQEEVNLAVLSSLRDLTSLEKINDIERRNNIIQESLDRIDRAYSTSIKERDKREKAMNDGQASLFFSIRAFLIILGAFLLVVGKWFLLSAAEARKN